MRCSGVSALLLEKLNIPLLPLSKRKSYTRPNVDLSLSFRCMCLRAPIIVGTFSGGLLRILQPEGESMHVLLQFLGLAQKRI